MIKNNVTNLKNISVEEFLSYEFNSLKDKNRDVTNLVNSIKKTGFDMPVYIWAGNDYVIDGAGRKKAIETLLEQGEMIESIPVVEIYAKDLNEAKQKVLQVSSKYGEVTKDSFIDFTENLELDFDVFDLGINLDYKGYDDKNKEISLDDLSQETVLKVKFKDYNDYLKVLEKINIIKEELEIKNDDDVILHILNNYEL